MIKSKNQQNGIFELNRFNYLPNGCTKKSKTALDVQKVQSTQNSTKEVNERASERAREIFSSIRILFCDKIQMKTCQGNERKARIPYKTIARVHFVIHSICFAKSQV